MLQDAHSADCVEPWTKHGIKIASQSVVYELIRTYALGTLAKTLCARCVRLDSGLYGGLGLRLRCHVVYVLIVFKMLIGFKYDRLYDIYFTILFRLYVIDS